MHLAKTAKTSPKCQDRRGGESAENMNEAAVGRPNLGMTANPLSWTKRRANGTGRANSRHPTALISFGVVRVGDGTLDRWWAQLEATMLYRHQRVSVALWAKLKLQMKANRLTIWWRDTKKPNQRQCVLLCSKCRAAIRLMPGNEPIQDQINLLCQFLRLAVPTTGADV